MLIASVPVFVMLPCSARTPPWSGSVMILPLLVSVPAETISVALSPQPSALVSVIVPALMKLAAAVAAAFSLHVLSIDQRLHRGEVAAQRARPRSAIRLLPLPV